MALVEAIMKQSPDCDHMMAETLIKMHEQNKLARWLPNLGTVPIRGGDTLGTIYVAQNKSDLPNIACQEATSADSSSSTPPSTL